MISRPTSTRSVARRRRRGRPDRPRSACSRLSANGVPTSGDLTPAMHPVSARARFALTASLRVPGHVACARPTCDALPLRMGTWGHRCARAGRLYQAQKPPSGRRRSAPRSRQSAGPSTPIMLMPAAHDRGRLLLRDEPRLRPGRRGLRSAGRTRAGRAHFLTSNGHDRTHIVAPIAREGRRSRRCSQYGNGETQRNNR